MSTFALMATVLASLIFLAIIVVRVRKQITARKDQTTFDPARPRTEHEFDLSRTPPGERDFDLSRSSSGEKEGFDFNSKRRARRKSIPGPWGRRR
jgi:hypothetical protein